MKKYFGKEQSFLKTFCTFEYQIKVATRIVMLINKHKQVNEKRRVNSLCEIKKKDLQVFK